MTLWKCFKRVTERPDEMRKLKDGGGSHILAQRTSQGNKPEAARSSHPNQNEVGG